MIQSNDNKSDVRAPEQQILGHHTLDNQHTLDTEEDALFLLTAPDSDALCCSAKLHM